MHKFLTSLLALLGLNIAHASDALPNTKMNKQVIQALIDAGSTPHKPHPLEHHFYCFSSKSLNALMSKGKVLGYRSANLGDSIHEGTPYWYGDLIKETVLDLSIIDKENVIMLNLANEFKCDYDGWGTPVVK